MAKEGPNCGEPVPSPSEAVPRDGDSPAATLRSCDNSLRASSAQALVTEPAPPKRLSPAGSPPAKGGKERANESAPPPSPRAGEREAWCCT
jgi:hypothetical protein